MIWGTGRCMVDKKVLSDHIDLIVRLLPGLETVFLPTKPELACVSSSAVREAAFFGADFSSFVPPCILVDVKNHFNKNS